MDLHKCFLEILHLIIADEPTVGLDPEQRNVIRGIFPIISKERIVLITTHIVEDIESYCNSLIVMRKGQLIYSGGKKEFIEKAKGYIWNTTLSAEEYMKVYDKWNIIKSTQNEDSFEIRYISKEKLTNDSKVVEQPNLEDAYISYQKLWV